MEKRDQMPLLEHLGELRKRLAVVVVVNIAAAVVIFNYAEVVMQYLLAVNPGMQLVYISPSELFIIYVNLALISAVVLCSPITIYQIWAFIEKGLYKQEKAMVLIALFSGLLCFLCGAFFCYKVALPFTLEFFFRIGMSEIKPMISVESYTSFVNVMLLSFGVVFEMPVIVFLLTKLGILKPSLLQKQKGLLIVIIFIIAAVVTPPDVISQLMLAIPMVILLYLSIFISVVVDRSNRKKKTEEAAELTVKA